MSRGDTEVKNILESERVCICHFVSGKAASPWDKHNINWIPTLNLRKKEYRESEQKEQQQMATKERADRAKERRKRTFEQQEAKVAQKRHHLNQSGNRVVDIPFTETSTSTSPEESESASTAEVTEMDSEREQTEPLISPSGASTSEATVDCVQEPKQALRSPKDAETQTKEFEYMFYKPMYQAPN